MQDLQSKRELIDVDTALYVDQNFQEYKRLVYETTNLVEKFWQDLKKNDYVMRNIINVGKMIVENFLLIKDIYESVLEEKPDFRDIVILGIQFNQSVLNFEIEAMQQSTYLKNLEQKLKITKLNQYGQQQRNEIGMMLVSYRPQKRTKIILANKFITELTGYDLKEIIKQELNMLIPTLIASVHENLIKNFIFNEQRVVDTQLKRVWIRTCDGHIEPVQVSINTCISEKKGLLLVAFIDPIIQIKKKNFTCKVQDSYILLTDEEGFIIGNSINFANDFLGSNSYIQDIKINIDEMFHNLRKFKDEDLRNGIRTKMIFTFAESLIQNDLNIKTIDVALTQGCHKLSDTVVIREIIFSLDRQSEIKKIKHTIQDLDYEFEESQSIVIQEDHLDNNFGNGSSSCSSNSTLKSNELMQTKQIIDFQKTPQSILNVRRAIIVFFMTLAATSFAMLAVSIVSNNQFKNDQSSVQRSIYLVGQLANLRLTFRLLVQSNYMPVELQTYTFEELQQMMQTYYFQIKHYSQLMSNDQYKDGSLLNYYMRDAALKLEEIQSDGSITSYNTTFTIGIQQYLTKIESFMDMKQSIFKQKVGIFKIEPKLTNITINRQNVWYLIQNGNNEIRNFCILLADLYMIEGQSKETNYNMTVLIISVFCIGVTIIISLIFIPVTFALDNEEKEIVSYWMIIRDQTKLEVLANITEFVKFFQNQNMEKINSNQLLQTKTIIMPSSKMNSQSPQNLNNNTSGIKKTLSQPSSLQLFRVPSRYQQNKMSLQRLDIMNEYQQNSFGKIQQFENDDEEIIMNTATLKNKKLQESVHKIIQRNSSSSYIANGLSNNLNGQSEDQSRSIQDSLPHTMNKVNQHDLSYYSSTGHEKTGYLNETIDDMLQQKSDQSGEDLTKQLNNLFFYEKAKKSMVIIAFSSIIIGFYLGSYFICAQIFSQSSQSFEFQKVTSRRGPCLSTSFNVMIETFTQNATQVLGSNQERLDDYIRIDCSGFEASYLEYVKNPPSQFESVKQSLIRMDDKYACEMTFQNSNQINSCKSQMNGILISGVRSSIQSSYFFLNHNLVIFQARRPAIRDKAFLEQLEFNENLYHYIKLVLEYLIPMADKIRIMIDDSISEYLNFKMQQYIIIFSVFIIFLMISLVIALRVVIRILQRAVFRTRILIKIIPTSELKRINQTLKNSKESKN